MARSQSRKKSKVASKSRGKARRTKKKPRSSDLEAAPTEAAMSSHGTGKRLTPDQRQAIATAEGSLKEIAERFDTSINTVARYRKGVATNGASRRTRAKLAIGSGRRDLQVSTEGDFIVLRIPKSGIMKQVLGSMFE